MIGPESSQIVWTAKGFHPWGNVEESPNPGHDDIARQKHCPAHTLQKRGHLLAFYAAFIGSPVTLNGRYHSTPGQSTDDEVKRLHSLTPNDWDSDVSPRWSRSETPIA